MLPDPNARRICPYKVFFRHFAINTTWYLHSHVVCFNVSYVCIVYPFVNFERFTIGRLRIHSRSRQTPGVSPAELEDLDGIKATSRWLAKNLWLYDHTGIAQWRTLIDDIRWARRRHGITQFVIDNFMRLGFVKDDYVQQSECITALSALAMELEVHIHLVVHQNKSEGHKGQVGGKRSISGAFEIIANAQNIVEVQRDVNKGEKVSEVFQDHKIGRINGEEKAQRLKALNEVPDGKFILHAQREGEQQNASKYLRFLWEPQQYVSHPKGHPDHEPLRFVDQAAEADRQAANGDLPTSEDMD